MAYLPYHEPGITTLLSLSAFIILLNGVRFLFDHLLHCGLIGQILIGIIWGVPVGGTSWLSFGAQEAIQSLGYIGLIALVFEGGLTTDITQLRKTLFVSVSVATIGLCLPIAVSFILLAIPFELNGGTGYPTPLAAFSAGAAMCSTSLGTTFAILSSVGMQKTRTGTILVGAAMMDDVVGLVMVNIVTTLGVGGAGGWPIARPIVASFAFLVISLLLVPYVLKPCCVAIAKAYRGENETSNLSEKSRKAWTKSSKCLQAIPHLGFTLSIFVLIAYVTIAAFVHASVLFAAFVAGGIVSYLWAAVSATRQTETHHEEMAMYEDYYKPVIEYVLIPFFFASIGFSIPITSMFKGSIVWKGIIYSILMALSKAAVALVVYVEHFLTVLRNRNKLDGSTSQPNSNEPTPHQTALLIAFAMIARGEIGYLIASLSQSSGTLQLRRNDISVNEAGGEEIFLVIIWAVTLCTIVGPISVGILVRRLKSDLSNERTAGS